MGKTTMQDRELQDNELDLVSGGAVSQVLSNAFSNVLKTLDEALNSAARKA